MATRRWLAALVLSGLAALPAVAQDAVDAGVVMGGDATQAPDAGSPPVAAWKGLPNAIPIASTGVWLHVGGYAHLDVIYDFNAIGSKGNFAVGTIPYDAGPTENLTFQVNTSRLRFDAASMTKLGKAQASIEIDFFTSNGAPRIRHAYGELGRVMAGQNWSTFTDIDCLPYTLDFEAPSTFIVRRQPLVRYTHPLGEGLTLRVAAEYPNFVIDPGSGALTPGAFEVRAPDGVVRFTLDRGPMLLSASGVVRYVRYRETSGVLTEALGIGGTLMMKVKASPYLTVWAEAVGGQGMGGYRGLADLAVDTSNVLRALPLVGGMVGLTVHWLPNLRSTGLASVGASPFPVSKSQEETKALLYSALNVQWFPVEYVMVGLEGLFGQRSGALAGGEPASAHDFRLQGAMRVSLP
jgi:hypothetical protein